MELRTVSSPAGRFAGLRPLFGGPASPGGEAEASRRTGNGKLPMDCQRLATRAWTPSCSFSASEDPLDMLPLAIFERFCVCAAMHSQRIECRCRRSNSTDCRGSDQRLSPVVALKKNCADSPNSGASSGPCGASYALHCAIVSMALRWACRRCVSLRAKIASRGSSGGQLRISAMISLNSSDCGCTHKDSPETLLKKYTLAEPSSICSDHSVGRAAANMKCAATMTRPLASTRGSTPKCRKKSRKSQNRNT
mmetsp:Transcript_102478/g.260262  ORF Transcript_102478/g.260262 Transcript_102478/m.260262 type:complete len:251 (+) Transcript_102478:131-883(+)